MLPKFNLSELPSVCLLDNNKLPKLAAIYFVSDNTSQIIYIGRTINLFERWRDRHRFNQLKRMNRKTLLSISWMVCNNDINVLINLENEFIKLFKPPLNWARVRSPVRKITPIEVALQQSLQQLAKMNVMIFGFDPFANNEEPPTIYLFYPVLGKRGFSGSIRTTLKNINKKASALKWKEYNTDPKSLGKFGYWETEYNGVKIDLSPLEGLAYFMADSMRKTIAGVEFMTFNDEQLEMFLETPEFKEETLGLAILEDDPIPIDFTPRNQTSDLNCKEIIDNDQKPS